MQDDEASAASSDKPTSRVQCHRLSGLAVLVAAAALGLAACGGTGSSHVASLGKSSGRDHGGGSTTTTLPNGNPTKLLDEWAACTLNLNNPVFQAAAKLCAEKTSARVPGAGRAPRREV